MTTVNGPSGIDLDEIRSEYLRQCGPCDFGLINCACECPAGDPRSAMSRLVEEVEALRAQVADAEARGYRRAVEALRAITAEQWRQLALSPPIRVAPDTCAGFLEAAQRSNTTTDETRNDG